MTTNANKALIRQLFEAINEGDFEALEPHSGFWETRQVVPPMRLIFSDWRTTHMQQIAEGDKVLTYLALEFTHVAPFAGVEPTGQRVVLQGFSLDQVVDGVVVEHNSTTTWPGVFRQLGVDGFADWPALPPRTLSLPPFATPDALEDNKRVLAQLPQAIGENKVSALGLRNGVGDLMAEFGVVHEAFPDMQGDYVAFLAEDDLVGVRTTLRGTHSGPLWGIEPTGKPVAWDQFALARVAGGAVVEYHGLLDWTSALIQLGHFPAP